VGRRFWIFVGDFTPLLAPFIHFGAVVDGLYLLGEEPVTVLTRMAGWKLRRTRAEMPRPFSDPVGNAGLGYVVIARF